MMGEGGSASSASWVVVLARQQVEWMSKILPASTIPILTHGNVLLALVSDEDIDDSENGRN